MNLDSFSLIRDIQKKLLGLTADRYDEFFNEILSIDGLKNNYLLSTQIINSAKSIFRINDEKSNLCMKLLLDLFSFLKDNFTNEKIFRLFPFREYKYIMYNLMKAGFISQDFLRKKYSKGTIEYDYFLNPVNEDLKIKGLNESPIINSIRSDDLSLFQDLTEKSSINIESQIPFSQYERFISINKRPYLIEVAAFFGSINIFKYLFMRKVRIPPGLAKFAVAGGNCEIIHIIEDKNMSFDGCLEIAIKYFQTDIFNYLNQTMNYPITMSCFLSSIVNYNMKYFLKIRKVINDFNELAQCGFGNMMSPLHASVENGYLDIVQYLCSNKDVNININIPNLQILFEFKFNSFAYCCRKWSNRYC